MTDLRDPTAAVRAGQELDASRLRDYLASVLGDDPGELSIRQFPSGYSNLTYLLSSKSGQWVLRRPPAGTRAKSANDMGREFTVLEALQGHFDLAPRVFNYCRDEELLGAPFYLMEYVQGLVVRADYPEGLAADPALVSAHSRRFVEALAELHRVDYSAAGLASLGRPEGYAERQVKGWTRRHSDALTPGAPDFEKVSRWLADHLPTGAGRSALIHNDYKLDNLIWDARQPERLLAVLDWEMTTLGDPLMDLGATLGYWVQADDPEDLQAIRNMPSNVPGALSRREMLAAYEDVSGEESQAENFAFYYVYGLFRRAAICQQIYYRYYHGQSKDERFARLPHSVAALERQALRVIGGAA